VKRAFSARTSFPFIRLFRKLTFCTCTTSGALSEREAFQIFPRMRLRWWRTTPDREIRELLGYQAGGTLVNRKNLVILEDHHLPWDEPEGRLRVIGGLSAAQA
jgi:hypothetical protein